MKYLMFFIPAIIVYGLFAVCYGANPMTWGEPYQGVFIFVELMSFLAGMQLFLIYMEEIKDK